MSFSERMKLVPEKQIQLEDMDSMLRHRIANKVEEEFDDSQARYVLDILGYRTVPEKDPLNLTFNRGGKNLDRLAAMLEKLPWNNVYDVVEYGFRYLKDDCDGCTNDCDAGDYDEEEDVMYYDCPLRDEIDCYTKEFNEIFEQAKSGYRFIDGLISPIVGESEIKSIEEASNTKFYSVNTHMQKALQFYSDRENPDYENSIKESISAVEAMCCIIAGLSGASATLGAALKKLEENGIIIHGAMRAAFSQLYGYASDTDGIRHGGMDFKNAPAEDAKYMLVSCSAFVNYLLEKHSKTGNMN